MKLGLEFNCADTTIAKVLHRNGVATDLEKKHRDVLDVMESNKQEIIKLYTIDRLSGNEIGDKFNVSRITLYRYLHLWGIQVVDRYKRLDVRENKDKILQMYNDGDLMSEIAETFNCDPNCIINCLKEWGINPDVKRKCVGTYIENRVEKFLIEQGIEYQKQYKIERSKFDFYIPSANLQIKIKMTMFNWIKNWFKTEPEPHINWEYSKTFWAQTDYAHRALFRYKKDPDSDNCCMELIEGSEVADYSTENVEGLTMEEAFYEIKPKETQWRCNRCNQIVVNMRCGCTESPSPWEQI